MGARSRQRLFCVLVTALMLIAGAGSGRADMIDTSGLATWELCAICHSADGISRMAKFPKLAGQKPAYIEKQLREFRAEKRTNDGGPMVTNAGQLSDAQIREVARYFGSLPPPPPADPASDAAMIAAGRRLFEKGKPEAGVAACVTCHVGGGRPGVLAPKISAQHAGYLRKQLLDFRAEARGNDPGGVMRVIARGLTEDEIDAVSGYAATRKRMEGGTP